ncbi:MAG: hypothetical protein LBM76_00975 [Mycoplasmataceae bacterium]|nr:hypothetical protein [Mycoplasmataceae bacterium]
MKKVHLKTILLGLSSFAIIPSIFSAVISNHSSVTENSKQLKTISSDDDQLTYVNNLIQLHNLAEDWLCTNSINMTEINPHYDAATWLTYEYIKEFYDRYQNAQWYLTDGSLINRTDCSEVGISNICTQPGGYPFKQMLASQYPDLDSYWRSFSVGASLPTDPWGTKVPHMAAAFNSKLFTTTSGNVSGVKIIHGISVPTPISYLMGEAMSEADFNSLASWAGDIQKIPLQFFQSGSDWNGHDGSLSEDAYYNETYVGLTTGTYPTLQTSCGSSIVTWRSDADADNLSTLLYDVHGESGFDDVINSYYLGENALVNDRFTTFLKIDNINLDTITRFVNYIYTTPSTLPFCWMMYMSYNGTFWTDNAVNGISKAFNDFFLQLV